ncbi:hypothetical protein [Endozoicomonas numazuensis]|uniref:Uncharacterized protein n=1 Tax=Endozoicomonas numazuensis TaxID=1137799 RepID=A0A081NGV3_9GAMM|nr:hypothetical protein [Endozoicomonas numazuensis]KEQ17676.1 hypothetical protein GZ78_08245 [Endozoicomonas numazuensis]
MVWRSIQHFGVLLTVFCLQYSHALSTPLGEINNASTVRLPVGARAAEVTFTLSNTHQQAVQINVQPIQGQLQTAHIPFHLLNQIQNAHLHGVGMILPHIPAALSTLALVHSQNIPQFNQHLSIHQVFAHQGSVYLTLQGLNQNGLWVSIQITLSLNAPGEILVSLPIGFLLPTNFVIDMQPQQPNIAVQPPNLMAVLSMLGAIQMPVFQGINPETGQMEPFASF